MNNGNELLVLSAMGWIIGVILYQVSKFIFYRPRKSVTPRPKNRSIKIYDEYVVLRRYIEGIKKKDVKVYRKLVIRLRFKYYGHDMKMNGDCPLLRTLFNRLNEIENKFVPMIDFNR